MPFDNRKSSVELVTDDAKIKHEELLNKYRDSNSPYGYYSHLYENFERIARIENGRKELHNESYGSHLYETENNKRVYVKFLNKHIKIFFIENFDYLTPIKIIKIEDTIK